MNRITANILLSLALAIAVASICEAAGPPRGGMRGPQRNRGDWGRDKDKGPEREESDSKTTLDAEEWSKLIADMQWLRGLMLKHKLPGMREHDKPDRPGFPPGPPGGRRRGGPRRPPELDEARLKGLPEHVRKRLEMHRKMWEKMTEERKRQIEGRRKWLEKLTKEQRERVVGAIRRLSRLSKSEQRFLRWAIDLPQEELEKALASIEADPGKLPPVPEEFGRGGRRRGGPPGDPRMILDKLLRWNDLPDGERDRMPKIRKLTPEQRKEMIEKLKKWRDLSPEERDELLKQLRSSIMTPGAFFPRRSMWNADHRPRCSG